MSNEAAAILDHTAEAPTPTQTTQSTTETPKPQEEARVSPKLELLVKRESQIRHESQALAKQKEELQAALAKIQEFESAKGNSKKALELLGLNYDQLTQSLLKDGEIPAEVEIKKVRDEISEMKRLQELDKEKTLEEQKRQVQLQEQKAITDFKTEINTYLKDNASRYELIDFEASQELVFDVIDEHYTRTMDPETGAGKVLSIAEASDKVEKYLEEKYQKAASKNKIKTLWQLMPRGLSQELTKQNQVKSQPPKTLTNNLASTPAVGGRSISEEQRVAGIIAAFKAQKGLN